MSQKYPDPINGFDFIIGRGGKPTYRLNKKMTGADKVPEEIKAQLLTQYEQLSAARAAENAAAAAEEAAKNADEIVHAVEFDGDTLDDVQIEQPSIVDTAARLQAESDGRIMDAAALTPITPEAQAIADTFPTPTALPQQPASLGFPPLTAEEQAILDAYPTGQPAAPAAPVPAAPIHAPLGENEHPSMRIAALEQELERRKDIIEELMKGSVYEADLVTLAQQLAERFNIYTVFIGREPSHTDLHPITAEVMNNFDRGLAYKQYVRATLSGTLGELDKNIAIAQSDPRFERPMTAAVQPLPPQTQTMAERESSHLQGQVKNAESYGIDGVIQDPPVMANGFARQVVDPSWLNRAKTIDQFDLQDL